VSLTLLPVVLVILGVARLYPLLDLRTSHFAVTIAAALGGLGVAWLALGVGRRFARRSVVAAAIVVAAFGAFTVVNADWLRFNGNSPELGVRLELTTEDVRSSVRYVSQHRQPGDVILVSLLASYGFGYYWAADEPQWTASDRVAVRWLPAYPRESGIVIAGDRTPEAIRAALAQANQLATERGPGSTIWLVQSHVLPQEQAAWRAELVGYAVQPQPSGPEPVLAIHAR
jgi:hypothetical protein